MNAETLDSQPIIDVADLQKEYTVIMVRADDSLSSWISHEYAEEANQARIFARTSASREYFRRYEKQA